MCVTAWDTAWSRVPGGEKIGKLANEIIAQFDSQNPAASVPELLSYGTN